MGGRFWKEDSYVHMPQIPGECRESSSGVIKAVGHNGEKYRVAKIERQIFSDQQYQYIITPYWDVIDGLEPGLFRGIPGLCMDSRKKQYYRVNRQPVFVTERTPPENREDIKEIMMSVGLSQYDRFEWLLRTPLCSSCDNLIVERCGGQSAYEAERETIAGDQSAAGNQPGAGEQPAYEAKQETDARNAGVRRHRGRRPLEINREQLWKVAQLFWMKRITEAQAMEWLDLASRSTFYRKLRQLRDGEL